MVTTPMQKNGTAPARKPARGRPKRYGKRTTATIRFLPDHHDFLHTAAYLRKSSMAQILEEAIAEYAERHHAEFQELKAARKLRLPKAPPALG
jgi:hypothetical protein